MHKAALVLAACLALAACGNRDRGLRVLDNPGGGPDEFSVLMSAPLTLPEDLGALPPPTPGGTNRTDPNPGAEAIVALGGNPNAAIAGGIPAGDSALVRHVGRNGVDPSIRATLAAEDEAFRTRRARLSLFGNRDRYFAAYAAMALDAYAELIRFRNAGVAVPSAPPQ